MGKKYYAVTRVRGSSWNYSIPMRKQPRWDDHATFMDGLAEQGFIVLGGPLGDDENSFLLIFDTGSEKAVEALLSRDPWTEMGMLRIAKIDALEILLQKPK